MKIESLEYVQFAGTDAEWRIEGCSLGDVNLLVGRNASGKTRTINVISALANLVCGDRKLAFRSGDYTVRFSNREKTEYSLAYQNNEITKERLTIDRKQYLERFEGGKGNIFAHSLNTDIEFQAPVNELVCVSRRDSVQHPYFEDLYQWGKSVRFYPFGSQLGKNTYLIDMQRESDVPIDLKKSDEVVRLFSEGSRQLGDSFIEAVRSDMDEIGYALDKITLGSLNSVVVEPKLRGLVVKERELACGTDQLDMSQGMFRALALLIHLNYAELTNRPSCILIDDIGEGLDFERSTSLIKLLIDKTERASVQLIMTTNDRFVMNAVDLRHWCVVQRSPRGCRMHNYRNAKAMFEKFELTGLSNFDFFAGGILEDYSSHK